MTIPITYTHALHQAYPSLIFDVTDDSGSYESIVCDSLPSKVELDAWIKNARVDHMWSAIKLERDRRKVGGVKVGTNWFHSDEASRIQQLGLVMLGANLPPNLMWKTMNGTFVQMTQTLAQQVFSAVASNDVAIFTAAETHRAQMQALEDPTTYNFSTGWPLTFGE